MKQYQIKYLENVERVRRLSELFSEPGMTAEVFYEDRKRKALKIRACVEENMDLLRQNLIPLLDDIVLASKEEVEDLMEFADQLMNGKPHADTGLHYLIGKALIAYARHQKDRNLLIKELYLTAMSLYNLQTLLDTEDSGKYRLRMRMLFGEAAGFLRCYDEIEDVETRGYIHRSMGNLALSYGYHVKAESEKKLEVIRRSLEILGDPSYRSKTPQLPWDLFFYKSHQERTSALTYLRTGEASDRSIREVMESAEYVHNMQVKNAKEKGVDLQPQWQYTYYAASYHCGFDTLPDFFENMERVYASSSMTDYSQQGIYAIVHLPGLYSSYVSSRPGYLERKKPVLTYMYGRLIRFVKTMPSEARSELLFFYLRGTMSEFIEYSDGLRLKDYIKELIAGQDPSIYVHSRMVGRIAGLLLSGAIDRMPERLYGVFSLESEQELKSHREELLQFIYECGELHDIGKMNYLPLITLCGRRWIEEEEEIVRHHPRTGSQVLRRCPSTEAYADAALGHHRWYNGKGGYPEEYDRSKVREAALVDILSIADYLEQHTDDAGNFFESTLTLSHALEGLQKESGARFAPHFVELAVAMRGELEPLLHTGRKEAYEIAYKTII